MATGSVVWKPEDNQVVGKEHRDTYFVQHVRSVTGEVLYSFYEDPCVLKSSWPVSYVATQLDVDLTARRAAVVKEPLTEARRLLTAIAGAEEGCEDVHFLDTPAVTYYASVSYGYIPHRARALAEPDVGSISAPAHYDLWEERIGISGAPDAVDDTVPGQLTLRIDTVAGTIWANPAKTRQVVVWLDDPATTGAEAVVVTTCAPDAGPTGIYVTIPHTMGQGTSPSTTVGDYNVFVIGPYVSTVDPSADATKVLLCSVNTGVVDITGQNVQQTPEQFDDAQHDLQALWKGYRHGPAGDSVARGGMGCFFGEPDDQAWNDITPTVAAPEVVANFVADPFGLVANAFAWIGTPDAQVFCQEALSGTPWANYRYTPPGAATYTICLIVSDGTDEDPPINRATLDTHVGHSASCIAAGKLPLITYIWNGAAFTGSPVTYRLEDMRGERLLKTIGGDHMFMAKAGQDGVYAMEASGNDLKGEIRDHLLLDGAAPVSATIAFLRRFIAQGGQNHHELRVCAQNNAAGHTSGAGTSIITLGGNNDLALVGRKVGTALRFAVATFADVLAGELIRLEDRGGAQVDEIPAGSGLRALLQVGDVKYLGANGKLGWRNIPIVNPIDGRSYDNQGSPDVGHVFGPWVYGDAVASGANPGNTNAGPWVWLDNLNFGSGVGAEGQNYGITAIGLMCDFELTQYDLDHVYDLAGYATVNVSFSTSSFELTMKLIRRAVATGTVEELARLKTGAANRWFDDGVNNIGWRSLMSHGETGTDHPDAGGAGQAWSGDPHAFAVQLECDPSGTIYRYFLRFEITDYGLSEAPITIQGASAQIRRTAPW
jgi:hypothetical protein